MRKYNCQRICEVGVRSGRNFEKMIKHGPEVAVAVDIWTDLDAATNDKGYSQLELDRQYEDFRDRMKNAPNVSIRRVYSLVAAGQFEDNFFDLVYIDADHTFAGVYCDLQDWYPKVRSGGFLLGDDFVNHRTRTGVNYGIIDAVNIFTTENSLSYFVFPRHKWGLIKP